MENPSRSLAVVAWDEKTIDHAEVERPQKINFKKWEKLFLVSFSFVTVCFVRVLYSHTHILSIFR